MKPVDLTNLSVGPLLKTSVQGLSSCFTCLSQHSFKQQFKGQGLNYSIFQKSRETNINKHTSFSYFLYHQSFHDTTFPVTLLRGPARVQNHETTQLHMKHVNQLHRKQITEASSLQTQFYCGYLAYFATFTAATHLLVLVL